MRTGATTASDFLFVDTSAWCALLSSNDVHHRHAAAAVAGRGPGRLLTTLQVAAEVSRLTPTFDDRLVATRFSWHLWRGDFAHVVEPPADIQRDAWALFRQVRRTGVSFTDCVGAEFVTSYGIRDVSAYGRGFLTLVDRVRRERDPRRRREA
ncbi:PIN domain-containing protein [Streptomyces sp. TS71-3]|uniref:PIN domain-containing protein n=1 Tax=Streptomyces sp. TS71-3 TaxID=2733862 RepID=UPI001B1BF99D|nr:PIN domain-containing protein [Streptomyces sp. TS71-3]GHJ39843.1 hypothetical protein Sm713_54520 [Streptomyces sp. TS71-3]